MRTPRWFRDFCAWRWAPSVWLCAGALAFIMLALLIVPPQFDAALRPSASAPRRALDVAAQPSLPAPVSAPAEPPSLPEPVPVQRAAVALRNAEPAAPEPATIPPDFAANIADRGDRPVRSRSR